MDQLVVTGGADTEQFVHQAGGLFAQKRSPASLQLAAALPAQTEGLWAGVFDAHLAGYSR